MGIGAAAEDDRRSGRFALMPHNRHLALLTHPFCDRMEFRDRILSSVAYPAEPGRFVMLCRPAINRLQQEIEKHGNELSGGIRFNENAGLFRAPDSCPGR